MSLENPTWGAPRIHGELGRLGYRIAQSTVAKYMLRPPHRKGQSWRTFLENHRDAIAAIDMLVVPTATEQAAVVLRIFRELAAGKSALAIVRDLNAACVPNPNARQKAGENQWRQTQILGSRTRMQGIARNPIYRGEYIWGKTKISTA
jgi:hypothetical protein